MPPPDRRATRGKLMELRAATQNEQQAAEPTPAPRAQDWQAEPTQLAEPAPPDWRDRRDKFMQKRPAQQNEQQFGKATRGPPTFAASGQVANAKAEANMGVARQSPSRSMHRKPVGTRKALPSSGLQKLDAFLHECKGANPIEFIGDIIFEVLRERCKPQPTQVSLSLNASLPNSPQPTQMPSTITAQPTQASLYPFIAMQQANMQNQYLATMVSLQNHDQPCEYLQPGGLDFYTADSPSPSRPSASTKSSVAIYNMTAEGKVLPWTTKDVEMLLWTQDINILEIGALQVLPNHRAVLSGLMPAVKDRIMALHGKPLHTSAEIWLSVNSLGGGTSAPPTTSPQSVFNGGVFNTLTEPTALDHAAADLQRVMSGEESQAKSTGVEKVHERELLEKLLCG